MVSVAVAPNPPQCAVVGQGPKASPCRSVGTDGDGRDRDCAQLDHGCAGSGFSGAPTCWPTTYSVSDPMMWSKTTKFTCTTTVVSSNLPLNLVDLRYLVASYSCFHK
eukprot:SAG31_NODE_1762_length_7323_cov_10.940753_7_plen_107_part_00